MNRLHTTLPWACLVIAIAVPFVAAAMSPLLEWRSPVYIAAGFAGISAMALILLQPLLARAYLPGMTATSGKRMHRWVGCMLVFTVLTHVAGLWLTSPPDVIDALLFASPTPFSLWGVIAMWCVFAAAALAMFRRMLRLRARTWRLAHKTLVVFVVAGSVAHALLIEGTMEPVSKVLLCALVVLCTLIALRRS